MSSTVLAIDQGTSGTKAIVLDELDGVIAAVEIPIRPTYLPDGGVEQDPDQLLASVLDAGRQAMLLAGRPVHTVSLANQGESVLAWDPASGRPLSAVIVWQDGRAESVCRELQDHKVAIAQQTGLVLDPYFSAPKMAWLRRQRTTQGVVSTTDSWLIHQLCGEFVTDVSTAGRSMLTDLDSTTWNPTLLELFGLGRESLPRIVACDEIVGSTSVFGTPMTVAGLIVDQQAALLSQRCWDRGAAKCTFGTGAFLLANTGTAAPRSATGLTTSVAWRINGELNYCIDGQVFAVASAVRWMIDLGLLQSPVELDSTAAADSMGVLSVPSFAGLGAPWWRSETRASLTGLTLSTGAEHIVLAVLQGIAAQIAELAEAIAVDLAAPLTVLRVDGGLTRSATLMQAVADLTQLPVHVFSSAHATALGAAALGMLAGRPGLTIADALPSSSVGTTYEPNWSLARAAQFLDRWRQAAAATIALEGPA